MNRTFLSWQEADISKVTGHSGCVSLQQTGEQITLYQLKMWLDSLTKILRIIHSLSWRATR